MRPVQLGNTVSVRLLCPSTREALSGVSESRRDQHTAQAGSSHRPQSSRLFRESTYLKTPPSSRQREREDSLRASQDLSERGGSRPLSARILPPTGAFRRHTGGQMLLVRPMTSRSPQHDLQSAAWGALSYPLATSRCKIGHSDQSVPSFR